MVNLLDMQREPEKYGIDPETIENYEKKLEILTFESNEKKGYGVVSFVRGIPVFPDDASKAQINEHETWFCELKRKENVFNARAIVKIDNSFLFELKPDKRDLIVDILWNSHRDSLEPHFDKKYQSTRARLESDSIQRYEQEVEKLKTRIDELEKISTDDKKIIESLQNRGNQPAINDTTMMHKTTSSPPGFPLFDEYSNIPEYRNLHKLVVKRLEPDIIFSDSFTKTRYFVHMSRDKKLLLIRPHEYGDAICINGRINLIGLGATIPFDTQKELNSEYSPTYGGTLVHLR